MTGTYQWSRYTDKLLPWWLKTSEGGLAKRAVDTMLGAFCERALDGAYAHGPGTCPEDALPFFGRDRGVRRGINEPAASWRVRQLRALDDRLTQGNAFALHDQLRAYLQADVPVRTVDRRGNWYTTGVGGVRSTSINSGNWDWDGAPAAQWSRFWVIIYSFSGIPFAQSTAGAWPGAGKTIGTSATPEQVAAIRAIVREWQPDGTRCEWIIVAFDPLSFDPATPEPDGTWVHFGKYSAGEMIPARRITARYWKGVDGA